MDGDQPVNDHYMDKEILDQIRELPIDRLDVILGFWLNLPYFLPSDAEFILFMISEKHKKLELE